jgi:hypothetical protein
VADGRLRQKKLPRRLCKTAAPSQDNKRTKLPAIEQAVTHETISSFGQNECTR